MRWRNQKLQKEAMAEKKVTFTQDYNKRRGPSHGSGNWTRRNDDNGAMMSTPRSFTTGVFRPSNQNSNNSGQNRPSEESTWITTMIATMTIERDHNISRTKINLGNGDVTITIPDRLQRHDMIHPSRIFADNPDQTRLILQCSTGLGIKTRVTKYLTTRNSQLPTTVISQTWFDSVQQTMKLMNYRDFAL